MSEPPGHRSRWELAAAAVVSVLSTILMTWPLSQQAGHHVLKAIYYWDAYTNTMIMGSRVDAAIGRGPLSLYDSYFFAPLPHSIVFNENHFGLSLIFAPFYLLTDNPLYAYNLTLLVSLSLSVFFTYLLVKRLTGSGLAGILAGVAFTFSPYALFEIGRIQLVATQWIPACFLLLHRALCEHRRRDLVGFCVCYLLQIGTCLYYAMFLIPLLGCMAAVMVVRRPPPLRFAWQAALAGVASGATALAMVFPYFTSRKAFSLERTRAFASGFDGKLSFFQYVHDTNLTLTGMHHRANPRGAHEEIAFPGFTVLALLLVALSVPVVRAARQLGLKRMLLSAGAWLLTAALGFGLTLVTRSMLAGIALLLATAGLSAWQVRRGHASPIASPFAGTQGLVFGVFLLSVGMFLGLYPGDFDGEPIHGLYYYFHSYFPGFNGIRKVSRQAVMTTLFFATLSGFGAAALFGWLKRPALQWPVLLLLLSTTCFEFRSFPHPMKAVWAGKSVPPAYEFVRKLPQDALVTVVPGENGRRRFKGNPGMALTNYLALYHKHRMLNGKSTWIPPVTDLVLQAVRHLPSAPSRRILQTLDARYLLIHREDLIPWQAALPRVLDAQPGYYKRLFSDRRQSVYEVLPSADPTLALLDMPALPAGARLVPNGELRPRSNLHPELTKFAIDGDMQTRWTGKRSQAKGQAFELGLRTPRKVVALEIQNAQRHTTDLPMAFDLFVSAGTGAPKTVVSHPQLRIYRDMVFAPKDFVLRIVLPQPVLADRVRLALRQGVPGRHFSIHEARLYAVD